MVGFNRKSVKLVVAVAAAILVATFSFLGRDGSLVLVDLKGCKFPAIFNFGDSNSDTGTVSAAFSRLLLPYGETFFGKPSGRYSDGRLIIDFLGNYTHTAFLMDL